MPLTSYSYISFLSVLSCLILTAVVVCASYGKGSEYVSWAYNVGDQPVYRLLVLLLILFAANYSFSFALMLALLFMVINSIVPMLTELDETFVFGAPLTDCGAYTPDAVQKEGTPFYPMHPQAVAGRS
jgi:hypothetical protein